MLMAAQAPVLFVSLGLIGTAFTPGFALVRSNVEWPFGGGGEMREARPTAEDILASAEMEDRYDWPYLWRRMDFKKVAEVGVFKGRFAQNACRVMPDLWDYVLVDAWRHLPNYKDPHNLNDHDFELAYQGAMGFTVDSPEGKGKARALRGTSAEVGPQIRDNYFDVVYIDADHTLHGVLSDLIIWYPKVKSGGLICGNEYRDTHVDKKKMKDRQNDPIGVMAAVKAFATSINATVFKKTPSLGFPPQFGFIKP